MDNHPIPQNVTGFEFKLVGDMTLKQFAYLAGGSLFAYLIYLLPLPFFIKWPLAFIFAILGFSLAFLPIGGRPMDRMLLNFIKALLSENQFIYKKTPTTPEHVRTSSPSIPDAQQQIIKQQPLETSPMPPTQTGQPIPSAPSSPPPVKPPPQVIMPPSISKQALDVRMQPQKLSQDARGKQTKVDQKKQPLESVSPPNVLSQPKPLVSSKMATATPAHFANRPFAPPTPVPSFPNLISGRVLDTKGDFVPAVVIEVKDESGLALRAFKTNKLGQFASSTPLPNGTYIIELEDTLNRFTFMPTKLTLDGKEIPPLEIKPVDTRDELRKELFTTS